MRNVGFFGKNLYMTAINEEWRVDFFFKISKRDFTLIREMRVCTTYFSILPCLLIAVQESLLSNLCCFIELSLLLCSFENFY